MKALLIVAHGSRKPGSNSEVLALIKRVDQNTPHGFDAVAEAFLQFGSPKLADQIEWMAEQGARKIVIFPFFIAAGTHISSDIPRIVAQARDAHPYIEFVVTTHLGNIPGIETIIYLETEKY